MEVKGDLSKVASTMVLQCLWVARLTRPDIYWTVYVLARQLTKWRKACDTRLFRLISYIRHTQDRVLYAYVGDQPQHCQLVIYSDASFAESTLNQRQEECSSY
jgi:hypothetical protein